jgi:hypothetical protein
MVDEVKSSVREFERCKKIAFDFYKWREAIKYLAENKINHLFLCSDDPNDPDNYSNLAEEDKKSFEEMWQQEKKSGKKMWE